MLYGANAVYIFFLYETNITWQFTWIEQSISTSPLSIRNSSLFHLNLTWKSFTIYLPRRCRLSPDLNFNCVIYCHSVHFSNSIDSCVSTHQSITIKRKLRRRAKILTRAIYYYHHHNSCFTIYTYKTRTIFYCTDNWTHKSSHRRNSFLCTWWIESPRSVSVGDIAKAYE